MTNADKKINEAREEVRALGLNTDRDLIEQLGIKDNKDLKNKLHAWMKYQGAFYFKEGFNLGQEKVRSEIKSILDIQDFGE